MKYSFLFIIAPAVVSFLLQSILCNKAKNRILRYGGLIISVVAVVFGVVTLLTQGGDMFGGLGAIAAVLWFVIACCGAFGYGAAWLVFFAVRKRTDRERKE